MSNAFKQVEESLDFKKSEPVEKEKKEKEITQVDFNSHIEDIKDDYIKMRKGILYNLECAQTVIERLQESIEDSELDAEKFLARKAEVFATLLRVSSELRKDLFFLHKNKKDLLVEDEKKVEDLFEKSSINIKDFFIDNKKGFNLEIGGKDEDKQ